MRASGALAGRGDPGPQAAAVAGGAAPGAGEVAGPHPAAAHAHVGTWHLIPKMPNAAQIALASQQSLAEVHIRESLEGKLGMQLRMGQDREWR